MKYEDEEDLELAALHAGRVSDFEWTVLRDPAQDDGKFILSEAIAIDAGLPLGTRVDWREFGRIIGENAERKLKDGTLVPKKRKKTHER